MHISMIVAMSPKRVIGSGGEIPWHLPADLRHFKKETLGKPVIMGRKTFQSIIESLGRPLPERHNIVMSASSDGMDYALRNGCDDIATSLSEALWIAKEAAESMGVDEVMVIGGGKVYELFLPQADRLYITYVFGPFEGDTHFPDFDLDEWVETSREYRAADEKNGYAIEFVIMERKPA